MVKKQHQKRGGLITSLLINSGGSSTKEEVLPCPSTSSSMLSSSSSTSTFAWQWPSCGQPRTLSFREEDEQRQQQTTMMKQAYYKTMNSAYSVLDCSSNSFADSFSTATSESSPPVDAASESEAVVCALRSDRLFFEPDASSCIFKQSANKLLIEEDDKVHHADPSDTKQVAFGGATAMSVESRNPYRDFRESMEAVVMSHGGVKDWSWLEEMLSWYLKANDKSTHGLIVGAFVDLLVSLSNNSSSSSPATSSDDECTCSL